MGRTLPDRHSNAVRSLWTESEDDVLRQYFAEAGCQACVARLPGRTRHAVNKRAASLGIRIIEPLDPIHLAELQRICEGTSKTTLEELGERTGMRVARLRMVASQRGWTWPGRMPSRPWTDVEDRELAELYKDATVDECVGRLERDAESIKARVRFLGLAKRAPVWTTEEDGRLTVLYSTKSSAECAALLNRTQGAVKRRAHILGLTVKVEPRPTDRPRKREREPRRFTFRRGS